MAEVWNNQRESALSGHNRVSVVGTRMVSLARVAVHLCNQPQPTFRKVLVQLEERLAAHEVTDTVFAGEWLLVGDVRPKNVRSVGFDVT
jgi:hypothetical protein